MKKIIAVLLVVCVLFTFSACGECEHDWVDATCEEDEYCSICGQVGDWATGHDWVEATCEESAYCSVCGATDGEPLGHDWVDATCTEAEYCEVCGEKGEKAKGHSYDKGYCKDCYHKDPDYVDLSTFGFTNMYGMNVWIEVEELDFYNGYVMANRSAIGGISPYLRCFYDGYYKSYILHADYLASGISSPDAADYVGVIVFSTVSNSSINSERGNWTIYERRVDDSGEMLVLKCKVDGTERWYVPVALLDLPRTAYVEENGWTYLKLYFK